MNLSWIDAHHGETVVVKFGGNAMGDAALARAFCEDIVALRSAGIRIVVAHGGGPQISAELAARGIASEFRGGQRFTSLDAVEVVKDVLVSIGADLVTTLLAVGGDATAIEGQSYHLMSARKSGVVIDGRTVDLGQVGEVVGVETSLIEQVLGAGGVPVISAMGRDVLHGELLNINADLAAASLAVALHADWLLLLTDVAGLYRDWPNRDSLIANISVDEVRVLLPQLEAGMIPKVTAARNAVAGGVGRAAIVDGRVPHGLTLTPFGSTGTTIIHDGRNIS